MTDTKDFYTVQEVAEKLNLHPMTIQRRIQKGKLEAFRTNGDSGPYRISHEALIRYTSKVVQPVEVK